MTKKQKVPVRRKHVPQRTCIVCRQKFDKRQLVRIVRSVEAGVIVDPSGKINGRGAYLCQQPDCWDKIVQKHGLLNQALKTSVTTTELEEIARHKSVYAQEEAK